jgi:hypothetical protein
MKQDEVHEFTQNGGHGTTEAWTTQFPDQLGQFFMRRVDRSHISHSNPLFGDGEEGPRRGQQTLALGRRRHPCQLLWHRRELGRQPEPTLLRCWLCGLCFLDASDVVDDEKTEIEAGATSSPGNAEDRVGDGVSSRRRRRHGLA